MNDVYVIIYNDKTSIFKELLEKDNSASIHYRNIQALAIEMYKVANGMSPKIMNEIFQLREKLGTDSTGNLTDRYFLWI